MIVFAALMIPLCAALLFMAACYLNHRFSNRSGPVPALSPVEIVALECEALLTQAPPRQNIPLALLRAGRVKKGDAIGAGIAFVVTASGVITALVVAAVHAMGLLKSKASYVVVGLPIWVVSATAVANLLVRRLKRRTAARRRLLENGLLVSGWMSESSGGSIWTTHTIQDVPQLRVTFSFEINGRGHQVTQRISNRHPERTGKYLSGAAAVRLLVDPGDPTKLVWVEGTLMALPLPTPDLDDSD